MNSVGLIELYYRAASTLLGIYEKLKAVDPDAHVLLEKGQEYLEQAATLKKKLDAAVPDLEDELLNLEREILE